ncbi:MAG: RNA polymerase sigma factor [Planctomycetes bacterium]|nr:RNA polymerase sigma factor [Planctomycetota bacterium]
MNSPSDEYERFIRPIESQIIRSVWRITQNSNDAEDAFQEAMTQIWEQLPRLRAHPNPTALVLRICTNVACDAVRRKLRRDHRERSRNAAEADSTARDGTAAVLDSERRDQVQGAIARLPEQQATAVSMRFLLSCSYEEIAQALDCAEPTARVHVMRGLSRLRSLLTNHSPSTTLE